MRLVYIQKYLARRVMIISTSFSRQTESALCVLSMLPRPEREDAEIGHDLSPEEFAYGRKETSFRSFLSIDRQKSLGSGESFHTKSVSR